MEFHISRNARDRYRVRDALFSFVGNVIFADLRACRDFAHRMNAVRASGNDPSQIVHPGSLFAMGLIDEVSHALVAQYRRDRDPEVTRAALDWFAARIGEDDLDKLLRGFVQEFPSVGIYRGQVSLEEWLEGSTDSLTHREAVLEELILLWLANQNPAFQPFRELYDDTRLAESTAYKQVTAELGDYFATRPATEKGHGNLLDLLRAPVVAAPNSLAGQLAWIRQNWARFLGEKFPRLLLAADVLKEEEIAMWMRFHPPSEHGQQNKSQMGKTSEVPVYDRSAAQRVIDPEYERFSQDLDWMPNVVMIAKSTHVWLAQMSRQYGRAIERLDQIPDEELNLLAYRGINALWLIGVWERSRASRTIKQLCGQSEAGASAYSLESYRIADDLGGDLAYRNLQHRAAMHGIRLASDMVPNHFGIDSEWVIHHPERFLSRGDLPFAYSFNGPDLSHDPRVEIKIDDRYYDRSDAAVVFRRRDNSSGHIEYIYHGNDGTSFPWNDTAQLNYMRADVREQVIQTILHVARLFPIIRFDAAMTLARRQVQRLWFPLPGSGGAIPSRAESSMTQEQFDALMPQEFWREVVDRVAAEVPGTLLLAEAFWLLEGYFVRTLGMHRVYNSAFMNMLRDEENEKYRSVIKNTIEFDPDILKRYVNFMSNPDERTAIDQFGTGDKYFGVCTLMATLPGLPMFGHGQIEAFTERYGMEYKRPRYEETPNEYLVERHQREIAPLLRDRALFAESMNFALFDFYTDNGTIDENVFAYSNRLGDRNALVIYHNKYANTEGTLNRSAARADKDSRALYQTNLYQSLEIASGDGLILAFQDTATGLHYLRHSTEITDRGLRIHLRAYQYHVFQHWRILHSTDEHPWELLCDELNGTGVWSLDDELAKLKLRPVHEALRYALDPELLGRFAGDIEEFAAEPTLTASSKIRASEQSGKTIDALKNRAELFFLEASAAINKDQLQSQQEIPATGKTWTLDRSMKPSTVAEAAKTYSKLLFAATKVPQLEKIVAQGVALDLRVTDPGPNPNGHPGSAWAPVAAWCLLRAFSDMLPKEDAAEIFDRLYMRTALSQVFSSLGFNGEEGYRAAARVRILLVNTNNATEIRWTDPDVIWLTCLHEVGGYQYFNQEAYEQLLWWNCLPRLVDPATKGEGTKRAETKIAILDMTHALEAAMQAAKRAGYRLDLLLKDPTGSSVGGSEQV